mmetsp:Transcript_36659/g.117729  ORF Transcript_36659/g.117729 Transcript_36659/m.117729 type:complete len:236 (-) Transcript_36659:189-896(-)
MSGDAPAATASGFTMASVRSILLPAMDRIRNACAAGAETRTSRVMAAACCTAASASEEAAWPASDIACAMAGRAVACSAGGRAAVHRRRECNDASRAIRRLCSCRHTLSARSPRPRSTHACIAATHERGRGRRPPSQPSMMATAPSRLSLWSRASKRQVRLAVSASGSELNMRSTAARSSAQSRITLFCAFGLAASSRPASFSCASASMPSAHAAHGFSPSHLASSPRSVWRTTG